ncbi:MAG: cache domain-containing protein [Succinivibrionaceae bacterium]|nr:cache domain-containing protein [Succinivibrionaceae bacterium]
MNRLKTTLVAVFFLLASGALTALNSVEYLNDHARSHAETRAKLLTNTLFNKLEEDIMRVVVASRTMANDTMLAETLLDEENVPRDMLERNLAQYLHRTKEALNFDVAFLVSEGTYKHYSEHGFFKMIDPLHDIQDRWYQDFTSGGKPFQPNIDSDETQGNNLTLFCNARIEDHKGNLLGAVGMGLALSDLQEMFKQFERNYNVKIHLINEQEIIQVDSHDNEIHQQVLGMRLDTRKIKDSGDIYFIPQKVGYNAFKYVPELNWYLVVRSDEPLDPDLNGFYIRCLVSLLALLLACILICFLLTRRVDDDEDE